MRAWRRVGGGAPACDRAVANTRGWMPSALEPYPVFGTVQCAQAPVWEHTASLAESFQPKVKFAKVDCTDANNEQLCADNHIQAYPTIILFSSVNGEHAHEFYHGMGLASLAARSECSVRRLRQRLDVVYRLECTACGVCVD